MKLNVIFNFIPAPSGAHQREEPVRPQQEEPLCADGATGDCRCLCGSLLARLVEGAVELKCRRCKRTLLVPLVPESARATAQGRTAEVIPVRRAG
jgi:phage FluMu protein Com